VPGDALGRHQLRYVIPRQDSDIGSVKDREVTATPDVTFSSQRMRLQAGKWVAIGTVTAHGVAARRSHLWNELRHDDEELILRGSAKSTDRPTR
jgi:hypothetical protein